MSDGEQSEPENGCLSLLSSCFRPKHKAVALENTHRSPNPAPDAGALPIKSAPESEQLDPPISSLPPLQPTLSPTQRPASSVTDKVSQSPDTTAAAPDLWFLACQQLDKKTQTWILDNSEPKAEGGKQWATDLIALVQEREAEYKDKTPKIKVGNREIIWRDYANKTVTLLLTIGDIAVNFAPTPSPIIWSSLKVFMKTNVAQCEDLVAIFGCAEKVLSLMRRGAVYEIVYLQDAPTNTAAEDLQKNLVDLYKALLQLLCHAFARLNEGQGQQFLRALICPGEGTALVSALSNHENKLSMAVQACGAVELQEHQKLLQSLSAPLRRVDENVKNLVEHLHEKSLDEALDYISAIPIGKHHFEKRETRTPETCEWLLNHPGFLDWEKSSCSSTLWLQGNIGAGKSYLTSKVIDRYWFDNEDKAKHDEGFAYFYCSRSDPARRDPKSIYQSYVRQLARISHYSNGMHKSIADLYRKARGEQRELSIAECKTALSELLKSYPQTTLILDALDECELEARHDIIVALRSLVTDAERPVKVYIASRREPDIERAMGSENLIEIGTANNKDDIEKYIDQEMRRFGGAWESVSEGVRDKVKRTITDESDGMFRWAYLQWEQLKKFKTDQSILERLGRLPKSLEQAYDEIYSQNDGLELVILQRAAKWVLCAAEPLSDEMLLWVIRLGIQSNSKAEAALTLSSPITQSTLESICCNLIVRDSQLNVWKFPHASAAEYFEDRHKVWMGNAHEDVAVLLISCLIACYSKWPLLPPSSFYLNGQFRMLYGTRTFPQYNFSRNLDLGDCLDPRHPLQYYAMRFWAWHARKSSSHLQVSPVLKQFLGAEGPQISSSQPYRTWCYNLIYKCAVIDAKFEELVNPHDLFPTEKSIFGICALGLHTLLDGWWDKDIDVSLVNDKGRDLLSLAAKYGHPDLCSSLIDYGSDMNRSLPSANGSAFLEALGMNQVETGAFFLDRGYNPNCISRGGQRLLCLAVRVAESFVEILLKAGADPNIQCRNCKYYCALETAAQKGKTESAKMLIDYGADVNLATQRGEWGSPLAAAANGTSLESVKLLVKHGASVNAQLEHGDYGSALAAALFGMSYDVDIVKYLVEEAGADARISFSRPRQGWFSFSFEKTRESALEKARYLVERGYIQENDLTNLGLDI
ncbi:hypothetical protein V8C42DRAFT_321338 [Trichoderma barbatum]